MYKVVHIIYTYNITHINKLLMHYTGLESKRAFLGSKQTWLERA